MSELQTRFCRHCKIEKNIKDFDFRNDIKNYRKQCKVCMSEKKV